jgi:hypothetical protein
MIHTGNGWSMRGVADTMLLAPTLSFAHEVER